MKRFFENTLISGAFSKALRVVALLCVLLGVSTSAWGAADFQQTDTWNVKYYPGAGNDTWGKGYAVEENANLGEFSGAPYLKGVWVKTQGGTDITSIDVEYNGKKVATLTYGGNSGDWNRYWSTESLNEALSTNTGTNSFTLKFSTNTGKYITRTITYTIAAQKYYLKHPWDGSNWSWKELTYQSGTTYTLTANYGGNNASVDYNTANNDNGKVNVTPTLGCSTIAQGTSCTFTFDSNSKTVNITPTAGCGSTPTPDPTGCTTVYLNTTQITWDHDGAELYVYYWNNTKNTNAWKKLTAASSCPKIFYASIPNDSQGYKFVRLNNVTGTPSWDRKWNETGDIALETSKTEFKLTDINGGGSLQAKTCNEEAEDCGGSDDSGETTVECDYVEVWCKGSSSYVTMNCYAWTGSNHELLGAWPGQQTGVTKEYTVDGAKYAVWSFPNTDNINIIFNNGSGKQTQDITGLRKGTRYIFKLQDDWSVTSTTEKIDCSLPATNVLLAREAKVDVSTKTGVVYGYLKNNPDCKEITDYGFYFCTTADGAAACTPVANNDLKWSATETTPLPRGKEFSANTGELFDGTTYYYRAYAVIGDETVLSQEVRSITTEPCKAQKAWGDPVVYTVDATFAADNVCKLYFRDVQKAIDHLKGSYVNEEDYQYVTNDNGSFNLNQPVIINVRYYDDTPDDQNSAYLYRGTTSVGKRAGDAMPKNSNLIQDFNKTATNPANTLTIKAGTKVAKPWVHHIVLRNSRNIVLDSLCIYSEPNNVGDNALEMDIDFADASSNWKELVQQNKYLEDANILVQNCMIGSDGFTGAHISSYCGVTFKKNDFEIIASANTDTDYGASFKLLFCKDIKFIENNFRGDHATLMWIQEVKNMLVMNNVFWNTNKLTVSAGEQYPAAMRLVTQFGSAIENIGFFYNTYYFAENNVVASASGYDFLQLTHTVDRNQDGNIDINSIKFKYNNCYSYDHDAPGRTQDNQTIAGYTGPFLGKTLPEDNFCENNFWSEYDQDKIRQGQSVTKSAFAFGCSANNFINVTEQVCETTASGPASLIIKGDAMNLGSAPDVAFTGIKLDAEEVLADRYLVGVRPNGEGWTYGAYQTREAKDVQKIYWVGVTDKWDDRNNWEFEVKNNDKIVRQRVSCVENLSENLHVVIEEIGTVEVTGGRKWPRIPSSFNSTDRENESKVKDGDIGVPEGEQVSAGLGKEDFTPTKYASYIELEYGAGIIGVENLVKTIEGNEVRYYDRASTEFISPRSEWILVGPTIKPWDEETPTADDVRDVLSGDYYIANHEPHVYMHKAMFLQDGNVGWDLTFADLKAPLTQDEVFAMQIPDEYGQFKLPAELHYAFIAPNDAMLGDATVSKQYSFEGRFYNESRLPKYTSLTTGTSVLRSNTYPANINAEELQSRGGTVQVYDYVAKSFKTLAEASSTAILPQHGFVFTPGSDNDLEIPVEIFMNTITKRSATVVNPYCRINVKNMTSNASSEVEVELDELKEDVADYNIDAPKVFNSMEASLPDMYIMRYDKKWADVTVPTMAESIPLGVRISKEGTTIRFSLVNSKGIGDVVIEDRLEGKTYNLTAGQLCEFSDLPVGDCEGRFYLNLSEEDIEEEEEDEEIDEDVTTEVDETFNDSGISIIGRSNGVVVSCSSDIELQTIYINDMSGKTAAFRVSGQYANIELPVAQGVYTVNVIADKANKTGKVILK